MENLIEFKTDKPLNTMRTLGYNVYQDLFKMC